MRSAWLATSKGLHTSKMAQMRRNVRTTHIAPRDAPTNCFMDCTGVVMLSPTSGEWCQGVKQGRTRTRC